MQSKLIEESRFYVKDFLKQNLDFRCTYHNFEHTAGVINAAQELSQVAKLTDLDQEDLILAAIFHDVGYTIEKENHEHRSANIAREYLLSKGLQQHRVKRIGEIILATKLDSKSTDPLHRLIKDADMYGLAANNYDEIASRLLNENNLMDGTALTSQSWIEQNISFLKAHEYHTKAGKKLYKKAKKKNLKRLIQKLEMSNKEEKLQTIASSKSAQTQLKTALRNHIDLSAIADNKANIMLSVNAIVITVGLPLLIDRIFDNPNLLIPTVILALSSVISMIFATLATRPIKMTGLTSLEDIPQKRSNLFFFGNYYKMNFNDYEEGIKTVISDNELLDNSITRDLFFLGKSLGQKYDKLRICYNVFMIGLVIAVFAFAGISLAQ